MSEGASAASSAFQKVLSQFRPKYVPNLTFTAFIIGATLCLLLVIYAFTYSSTNFVPQPLPPNEAGGAGAAYNPYEVSAFAFILIAGYALLAVFVLSLVWLFIYLFRSKSVELILGDLASEERANDAADAWPRADERGP